MTYDFIMEWNTKTPYQWEWENLVTFNGNTNEVSEQSQPINWEAEVDGGIDSVSLFSSGCCPSSSNFGNGSSSKSSISVSFDSSTKGGIKIPEFNFEDPNKKKELGRVEDNGSSSKLPLLGLKLGKRTYFEDVCAENIVKPPSLSVIPKLSIVSTKRSRSTYHNMQTPRCQVEGCDLDLSSAKDYHRRHRVCDRHTKYPKVTISGLERRFCQQCSRFHDLSESDEKKRSCRRRLSDHNARRRKPAGEAMQLNSARRSSSLYDGRHQMSFLTNRVPIFHITKSATNPTWGKTCQKLEDNTQHLSSSHDLHNSIPLHTPNSDRVLSFKGTTKDIFHEGTEASTLDKSPDLRHALSLLSFNSGDPEKTSFQQLIHGNNSTSMAHQAVPDTQGWSLTSLEYW